MGMKMEIRDSLHKKLDGMRVRNAAEKAVTQTMYDLMKESMKESPVDTGNLRRSHSTDVRVGKDMVEGFLNNSTNYWQYVQFGTSRHHEANDFVTRAFSKVAPEKKTAEYFKKYYSNQ